MEPIATESIYNISDDEKCQLLKSHFKGFFSTFCSDSKTIDGVNRYVSGIPSPFLNAVVGDVTEESIVNELVYFNEIKTPFVWYIDEYSDPKFKMKLIEHGFQDLGIFRGVIGALDQPLPDPEIPEGCSIGLVKTEAEMEEFNELVCAIFEIHGESKDLYRKSLWKLANTEPPRMFHWVARKEGKVVSALSTYIEGNLVSFWNGASLSEVRKQGFSTAIRRFALKDAVSRGCQFGTSYLMSSGLALGICSQLGYETKWRFQSFLAP